MQNKYIKFLLIALIVAFIVPQMALAAWWNPMSWSIWNYFFPKQASTQQPKKSSCITIWECGWTPCVNGEQTQKWIDSNDCGVPLENIGACPQITRACGSTDQTAGWKTYKNDEYGFEIKYPSDWQDKNSTENLVILNDSHGNWRMEIGRNTNVLKNISKELSKAGQEDIEVFGIKSEKVSYSFNDNILYILALVPYQNSTLEIDYASDFTTTPNVANDNLLFDQILSTFKFTK